MRPHAFATWLTHTTERYDAKKKYTRVHGDDQLSMREREILRSNFAGDGGCAAPDSRETMAGTARVTPAVRNCFAAMLLRLAASELLLLLLLLCDGRSKTSYEMASGLLLGVAFDGGEPGIIGVQ